MVRYVQLFNDYEITCFHTIQVTQGMAINKCDYGGATSLHFAAASGSTDAALWLLSIGARIQQDITGGTPLHEAAVHGKTQVCITGAAPQCR